jgi:hypothetical protein
MTYIGKSYFILNLAFKDEPFQNISYVLDVYGGFVYIAHHLERMKNNIGQTFGKEKHFHIQTTLKPFNSDNIILK